MYLEGILVIDFFLKDVRREMLTSTYLYYQTRWKSGLSPINVEFLI